MDEIINDLSETSQIVNGCGCNHSSGHFKIYATTNENLKRLFSSFSVKDKKVLSVLASSDQVFCSYYYGAGSVDTFDRNKLTNYYYYLRKWLLLYEKRFYPTCEEIFKSNKWIDNVLSLVKCESLDEEKAFKYWSNYVSNTSGYLAKNLFITCGDYNKTGIDNLSLLTDMIKDKDLVFNHQNIVGKINKSFKYDIVLMSNILEYLDFDKMKLIKCRDNLYDILEDSGKVICSNLTSYYPTSLQQEIFNDCFYYDELSVMRGENSRGSIGYCYTKRK